MQALVDTEAVDKGAVDSTSKGTRQSRRKRRRLGSTKEIPKGACAKERPPELGTNDADFGFSVSDQIPVIVPVLLEEVGPALPEAKDVRVDNEIGTENIPHAA